MKFLYIFLFLPLALFAGDIIVLSKNPLVEYQLDNSTTLSITKKQDSNLLQWMLTTVTERSKSSTTSGEGVRPGEPFVYFWDAANKTLWFGTVRTIEKTTFMNSNSSKSLIRSTSELDHYSDLPNQFKEKMKPLLKAAEQGAAANP